MTLRRFLNWVIGLPLAIIVIAFCVANRQAVSVSFDPFSTSSPWATMDMPLWALFFTGIFCGLITGWVACWFGQGKWRRASRDTRIELKRQQEEVARLRRDIEAQPSLPAEHP